MKYVLKDKKKDGCVFCAGLAEGVEHDRENFILYRGEETFAVMNIFPYNAGHVMVLPRQHVSTLVAMSHNAQLEMIMLVSYFTELLTGVMGPDGFNVGINLGKTAGAGIDAHLHTHIVPRWAGDSNFMPVIGETRVLPEELSDTYDKIVAAMKEFPPPSL
jgi:ATP adenylyltransferase